MNDVVEFGAPGARGGKATALASLEAEGFFKDRSHDFVELASRDDLIPSEAIEHLFLLR
jgi:hypothetical protein